MRITYLIMKEALLHAIIGANVLENVPSKLLVELPGNVYHDDGGDSDDDRSGNQVGLDIVPQHGRCDAFLQRTVDLEDSKSHLNLLKLESRVDQESQIGDADADDLNCVLHAQRIQHEDQFVKETENK